MKKTIKRNVVISAVLAIMLCVSLITGATFALFTSESKVNVAVTSGKVKVTATASTPELGTTLANGNLTETTATLSEDGNTVTLDKIVPGDYVTFNITIHNESNVTAQYRTVIELVEDDGLWAGLEVTFDEVEYEGTTAVKTEWATMAVSTEDTVVAVKVSLPEEAGNEYQEKSCKFSFAVEAVQGNAQTRNYGIKWSGNVAPLTRGDDTPAGVKTLADVTDTTAKTVKIETPELLAAFAQSVNGGNTYLKYTVTLEADMDLDNLAWTPIGTATNAFWGNFDGQEHAINNLKITSGENVGLFGHITLSPNNYTPGIENLTLYNVTIQADNSGAFVGNANTTTRNAGNGGALMLTNLKLLGKVIIEGANVGGIIGTAWTDFQISATEITVDADEGSHVKGTGVIGGVFASTPHGSVSKISSNIVVLLLGKLDEDTDKYIGSAGGIVGCAGWTLTDVTCTGDVYAECISETDNGKYEIGKIVGKEANNPYWRYYKNTTLMCGSEFKNFTANNTITIADEIGEPITSNGLTSADKKGNLNLVDYDQSLVGAPIWDWLW